MKTGKRFSAAFAVSACALIGGVASAGVVTFDNLDASGGDIPLNAISPYAALNWANTLAYTSTPGFGGFNNGIVSPNNAAYSGGQVFGAAVTPVVGSISAGALFDFESAFVGAGYYDNLVVNFKGLRAGTVLFSQDVTVGTGGPTLFSFGFADIDTLLFEASTTGGTTDPFSCGTFNCTQFTMDDLSITLKATPPPPPPPGLPEPSSLALVGLAALGLLGRRRAC